MPSQNFSESWDFLLKRCNYCDYFDPSWGFLHIFTWQLCLHWASTDCDGLRISWQRISWQSYKKPVSSRIACFTSCTCLPYVRGTSDKIKRICNEIGVELAMKHNKTIGK